MWFSSLLLLDLIQDSLQIVKKYQIGEILPTQKEEIEEICDCSHLESCLWYGGLYNHKMERSAMENFLSFDLNQDGLISLEEAKVSNSSNDEFEKVDVDKDGFVHPAEFDVSLSLIN